MPSVRKSPFCGITDLRFRALGYLHEQGLPSKTLREQLVTVCVFRTARGFSEWFVLMHCYQLKRGNKVRYAFQTQMEVPGSSKPKQTDSECVYHNVSICFNMTCKAFLVP